VGCCGTAIAALLRALVKRLDAPTPTSHNQAVDFYFLHPPGGDNGGGSGDGDGGGGAQLPPLMGADADDDEMQQVLAASMREQQQPGGAAAAAAAAGERVACHQERVRLLLCNVDCMGSLAWMPRSLSIHPDATPNPTPPLNLPQPPQPQPHCATSSRYRTMTMTMTTRPRWRRRMRTTRRPRCRAWPPGGRRRWRRGAPRRGCGTKVGCVGWLRLWWGCCSGRQCVQQP